MYGQEAVMRQVVALGIVWIAAAASASAQVTERLDIAGIVRSDNVSFEGGQSARLPVAGASVAYRVWKDLRVEAEITRASGESRRTYEADFISYAGPDATREEIARMAVIAKRTTINKAGLGFAAAVAAEKQLAARVNAAVRAGIGFRQYSYVDDMTVLRVPEGVTLDQAESAMRDDAGRRGRSGLLFGASLPVRIIGRLYVAPEVRWVWGGPARVGSNYDERTVAVRVGWKF
jgi:hypothetical protein